MPNARATLTIGFYGGPRFRRWSKSRRRVLEDEVTRSIDYSISDELRITWGSLALAVDKHGAADEADVRRVVQDAIAKSRTDPATRYVLSLTGGANAVPDIVQGTRTPHGQQREHSYALHRARKLSRGRLDEARLWLVRDRTEPARILAQLTWETRG